jgi:hypothetical protein
MLLLHPPQGHLRSPSAAVANPWLGGPVNVQSTYNPYTVQNVRLRSAAGSFVNPMVLNPAIQCYGNVIQPDFWDYTGYVTDALSILGTVAQIIAAISVAAGAQGWGWIVPIALPLCAQFVSGILKVQDEKHNDVLKEQEGWVKDYGQHITTFVTGITFGVLTLAKENSNWGGWSAMIAVVTSLIYLALEFLRVRSVDRQTLYGLVKDAVSTCCNRGGDQQALLS